MVALEMSQGSTLLKGLSRGGPWAARGVAVVALDGAVGKDAHKIAGGDLFAAGIIKADGDGAARLHGQRDPRRKNVPLGHQRKAGVAVHGERAHGIGHKAALCVRQADGGVAHPHGTV